MTMRFHCPSGGESKSSGCNDIGTTSKPPQIPVTRYAVGSNWRRSLAAPLDLLLNGAFQMAGHLPETRRDGTTVTHDHTERATQIKNARHLDAAKPFRCTKRGRPSLAPASRSRCDGGSPPMLVSSLEYRCQNFGGAPCAANFHLTGPPQG